MKFLSDNIGEKLLDALNSSVEVSGAMAFFSPDKKMQEALKSIPKLRLIVSDNFTINNPYFLEELFNNQKNQINVFETDSTKLHAKVLLGKLSNGDSWAIVGSANLTHGGFFLNTEACIWLDKTEQKEIKEIEKWLNKLLEVEQKIEWDIYKKIYDTPILKAPIKQNNIGNRFWVLKCRGDSYKKIYWNNFLNEEVLAIGWGDINIDPRKLTDVQLIKTLEETYDYTTGKPSINAAIINYFSREFQKGDCVIICNGYPPTSKTDVYVFGIATVEDTFYFDNKSTWWKMKIPAKITKIEKFVSKKLMTDSLSKNSLMKTIHKINSDQYLKFCRMIEKNDNSPA